MRVEITKEDFSAFTVLGIALNKDRVAFQNLTPSEMLPTTTAISNFVKFVMKLEEEKEAAKKPKQIEQPKKPIKGAAKKKVSKKVK